MSSLEPPFLCQQLCLVCVLCWAIHDGLVWGCECILPEEPSWSSMLQFFVFLMCSMVPHKTKRGAAALERLKVFEGVPAPYDRVKRLVVPEALQVLRLQTGHRFCKLGDLSAAVGASTLQGRAGAGTGGTYKQHWALGQHWPSPCSCQYVRMPTVGMSHGQ